MTTLEKIFTIFDSSNDKNNLSMNNNNNTSNHINNMINSRNSVLHLPLSNNNMKSPSLNQGTDYNNYQNKIQKYLEKSVQNVNSKEGFEGFNKTQKSGKSLTKETNQVLKSTDISSKVQSIDDLKNEYNNAIEEYELLMEKISGSTTTYLNRVNSSNPYLGKNIQIGGNIMYVTNQGVAKLYTDNSVLENTAGNNGCPASAQIVKTDIPWSDSYSSPGVTIPTSPSLITGTPMTDGQSCGNEGTNVFVNQLLNNPSSSYKGCYADNTKKPVMTFVGGAPPPPSVLQNGDFSSPQISNDSYQYVSNSSTVPGWTFNTFLVNNSSAWGYPMPYPKGSQCVSIQATNSLYQTIYFQSGVTYTLSFFACGRNCCDGSSQSNPINILLIQSDNTSNKKQIYNFQPPVSKWQTYSTTFTVSSSQNYNLSFNGTWNSGDRSTAIQNIVLNSAGGQQASGTYSYDQCQHAALDAGYQYFALQNVNPATSKGYCAISNSEPTATSLGEGYIPSGQQPLWSSNTQGQPGNTAILKNTGSLSILNSSGTAVFSTPNSSAQPGNYLGCYGDDPNRAMPLYNNGSQQYNVQQCQQIAQQNGSTYFGLQNSTSGTNAQCAISSNIAQTTEYGTAGNCTKLKDGNWSGGGWSNAVYNTKLPQSNYFLVLQDDGNLVIYRGTSPSDNQGVIWASSTNGKQQNANPVYAAAKGKYGKNWIPSGSTMAAGDFIGSTSGNIALIMQNDGNLVLYTFTNVPGCKKMSDGNMGGGTSINALYGLKSVGFPSNIGDIAYIDQDSKLHPYASSNSQFMNGYTALMSNDSTGNDIPNMSYGNATVKQCKSTCDATNNCAGFAFSNNTCYPKTSKMYPNSEKHFNPSSDLYIKNKGPSNTPIGVPLTTSNIDTATYQNYINGGPISNSYGLSNITTSQKQELEQLEQRINLLAKQMTDNNNTLNYDNKVVTNQALQNMAGLDNYTNSLVNTKKKIQNFNSPNNVDNILQDSDITVLQQNYNYLFWSILATGTVLVSMNILK